MDFFTTNAVSLAPSDDVSDFAQAIVDRFGHSASIFTARSTPAPPQPVSTHSPSFPPVDTADLHSWLAESSALIVDIRPHAAHSSARIPHAISLCVPSTLLKRPLFSLQKLCAMLPSAGARARFSAWPSSSRILVYDADSHSISDSSNISGLLRKFKADGFHGDLAWLKGGFQAVWKDRRDLVDTNPPDTDNDDDDDDHDNPAHSNLLRTRHLPIAAFSLSSTSSHKQRHLPPRPSANPFYDAIRQNIELSHGITERIPLHLPRRVRKRINDLPFPWLRNIAKSAAPAPRPSKSLSDNTTTDESDTDDDSDIPNATEIEDGKEALAIQFFKIELAEQKRLMGIMHHHSRESGLPATSDHNLPFPFSITAGVEKGAKNRYRHIWPFEHARVRLHQNKETDDDYVNASYVQPLGTARRYIATQGPLPATFTDFWTLCWEQNVHVIVMLTREVEGTTVKCGSYWTDSEFGPLRLKLVSTEGLAPPDDAHSKSSLHLPRMPKRFHHYMSKRTETVKRTFELSHTTYPDAKPRKVIHLQYLEWPDMNVPDDPRGVLGLIKQVDQAIHETRQDVHSHDRSTEIDDKTGVAKHTLGSNSPVLMHCSAGVGRTGGFIAVDAVLDAMRMELRAKYREQTVQTTSSAPAMEVDPEGTAEQVTPPPPEFNKAGTIRWAQNVRDETGIEGSQPVDTLYPSGSSSRTSSNPELIVHSNGNSSSSSANEGGVYLTTTSLATSVSGASSTCSIVGDSKENVEGRRSLSHEPEQITTSSFASSEGEPPSRSMSPPDGVSTSLQPLQIESCVAQPEPGEVSASEASAAHTAEAASTTDTGGGGKFDFKEPRPLHEDLTPPALSTFEDPICQVVQDMREQRMSLCQSLRQYVFVHAAVIEGSLMVLDEERELAEGIPRSKAAQVVNDVRMRTTPEIEKEALMFRISSPPPVSSSESGTSTPSVSSSSNIGHPSPRSSSRSRSRSTSRRRRRRRYQHHHHHLPVPPHPSASQPFFYSSDTLVPPSFVSSSSYTFGYSYGKRPSSPTELPKEDKKGEVVLSKRPSIERRRRNTIGNSERTVRATRSIASGIGDGTQER